MIRYIFITVFFISSCQVSNEENGNDYKFNILNCAKDFQMIFAKALEENKEYLVDSLAIVEVEFPKDFYLEEEIRNYFFIRFYNDITHFTSAIDTSHIKPFHEIHFIYKHEEKFYIDDAWSIKCNLNFLNNCGFKIYEASIDSSFQTMNLFDSKLLQKWTNLNPESQYKTLNFQKEEIIIDGDTLPYYQYGYEIYYKKDSAQIFERIAVSYNNLVLYDILNDETYYFKSN